MSESSEQSKKAKHHGKASRKHSSASGNNAERQSQGRTTVKAKTSPIAELSILNYRGTQFAPWKNEMATYMQRMYNSHGMDLIRKEVKTTYRAPVLQLKPIPPNADPKSVAALNAENEMLKESYKCDNAQHKKDTRKLQEDLIAMYSVIWGQLSDESQTKIRNSTDDFETIEANGDALLLWKAVIKVHQAAITGCTPVDQENARAAYQILAQGRAESLVQFKTRFDAAIEGLAAVGLDKPKESEKAVRFMAALDPVRFSDLKSTTENNVNAGICEYPNDVLDVLKMADNWKVAVRSGSGVGAAVYVTNAASNVPRTTQPARSDGKAKSKGKKQDKAASGEAKAPKPDPVICDLCKKPGHLWRQCRKLTCPTLHDDEPKPAANKALVVTDAATPAGHYAFCVTECNSVLTSTSKGGACHDVLLDNQATVSLFRCKHLLRNIRSAEPHEVTTVGGINAGGSSLTLDTVGDTEHFGTVYYNPRASANVLSLGEVETIPGMLVTYNQQDSVFTVDTAHGNVFVFEKVLVGGSGRGGALYVCKMRPWRAHILVSTVAQNEAMYTKRQVVEARLAKAVVERMGYPSIATAMKMITKGAIVNLPITAAQLKLALDIYGPDQAMLAGKTKQHKSRPVRDETIPVLVVKRQALHTDIFFVDEEPYLISVSEPMNLLMVNDLQGSREIGKIRMAIQNQIHGYVSQGFVIHTLHLDNEKGFVGNVEYFNTKGVTVNLCSPGQHVPKAENAIRVLKERMRCIMQSLPFVMPAIFMKWLVSYAVGRINMVPSRTSMDFVSPREKFTGRKTDYNRDLRIGFLQLVMYPRTSDEQSSSVNKARASFGLSLIPSGNQQGGVMFYNLETASTVIRERWTEMPYTEDVLKVFRDSVLSPSAANNCEPNVTVGLDRRRVASIAGNEDSLEIEEDIADDSENESTPQLDSSPPPAVATDAEGAEIVGGTLLIPEAPDQDEPEPPEVPPEPEPPPEKHGRSLRQRPPKSIRGAAYAEDLRAKKVSLLPAGAPIDEIYHTSIKRAEKEFGEQMTFQAISKELRQMLSKEVWEAVHRASLPAGTKIIRSSLFLKPKYDHQDPTNLNELKGRLVGDGRHQDLSVYQESDISSPTCSLEAIIMIAALAAKENRHVRTIDIGGAYLNAEIKADVYMRIEPRLVEVLCALDPSYRAYVGHDGAVIVKLKKALYGCVESGKLWYDKLSSILLEIGFTRNPYEKCVFNMDVEGTQLSIAVYVDDLLATCKSEAALDEFCTKTLPKFLKEVKVKTGRIHSFLGMTLNFSVQGEVALTMSNYISDMLAEFEVNGEAATPALPHLFEVRADSPLLPLGKKKEFHRFTAMLLYTPRRCRPDISVAVAFLSTRVMAPTEDDWDKLDRVMKYLNADRTLGIRIQPNAAGAPSPAAYVDAAYGVHVDGRSHTGCMITLGKGPVYIKSVKQKITTKSSTEAELVGLSDSMGQILWSRYFLEGQKYILDGATTVYQDNLSTIALASNGQSNSDRSRHINIRYFFVKDRCDSGEVNIKHMPTGDMIADILTKPLQGNLFRAMRKALMNWEY